MMMTMMIKEIMIKMKMMMHGDDDNDHNRGDAIIIDMYPVKFNLLPSIFVQ